MNTIWHEALFDPEADFRVLRPIRLDGRDLVPGDPFDKSTVTTRTLRLLYDDRKLEMVDKADPEPAPQSIAYAARHIGRGRYAVFDGDRQVSGLMTREEANAWRPA